MPRRDDDHKDLPGGATQLLKGFFAGILVAQINRRLMFGVCAGLAMGMYIEQTYEVPEVKELGVHAISKLRQAGIPGIQDLIGYFGKGDDKNERRGRND